MPLNEIHAPFYFHAKYATPQYPVGHSIRAYLASGMTCTVGASGDENNWSIKNGVTIVGSVSALWHEIMNRVGNLLPAGTTLTSVEVWQSIPDAPNLLVHLNNLPSGNSFGSGAGIAAAYYMYVFGTALRPQFRLTYFDSLDARPQKGTIAVPPDGDDGSIAWLFINSPYNLANNDGEKLTRPVSANTGYNRKLARRYGRAITP